MSLASSLNKSTKEKIIADDKDFQDPSDKKISPTFTKEDSVIFSGYLVDLNPFKEIGKYAAWLVFDLCLKSVKVTQKFEYEVEYDKLSRIVNNNQFKVTNMEIWKILNGLKMIQVNEDSQSMAWIGPDIINTCCVSYEDLKQNPSI